VSPGAPALTIMFSDLIYRLRALFRHSAVEQELDAELRFHLEQQADKYIAAGVGRDEALRRARLAFGATDRIAEECRDARGISWLEQTSQDVRYAARVLWRGRGFTAIAVLSLALGIGATTAVFAVLDAVVLRPLPVPEPDRLVVLRPLIRGERFVLFNPVFQEMRRRQHVFEDMAAISDSSFLSVMLPGSPAPTYVAGSFVSGSYFRVLRLGPQIGRLLSDGDDTRSSTCAAVISHGFWVRQFRQSPSALGQPLRVRNTACTIVGVVPGQFRSHQAGYAPDVWLPINPLTEPASLDSHTMAFFSGVIGRLRDTVTPATAAAALTSLYQQIEASEPQGPNRPGAVAPTAADYSVRLLPGAQGLGVLRDAFDEPLWIVLSIVAVFLLIATSNVATLLLARGEARTRELATRAAIGGTRGRLVRQLTTEGALLSLLGGAMGLLLARILTPAFASMISMDYFTVVLDAGISTRAATLVAGAVVLAALVTGVLPALRLSRVDLVPAIAGTGRATAGSTRTLARTLVTAQMALSLLLVFAAGLLLRTMTELKSVDPGFQPHQVITIEVNHEDAGRAGASTRTDPDAQAARFRALDAALNRVPGVKSAALSWLGLFGGSDLWLTMHPAARPDDRRDTRVDYVTPRYFETVGMQMVAGRDFSEADRRGAVPVIIVNETLARTRLGGLNAIGQLIVLEFPRDQQPPFTVIGIVRDSKYNGLREAKVEPMAWASIEQWPQRLSTISIRTEPGATEDVVRPARAAIAAIDPDLMVRKVTTLEAQVDETVGREIMLLQLASGFSGVALLLAAVGLYGTLAYTVARRTREFGIRMALGAEGGRLVRMMLREALTTVTLGAVIGIPLAMMAGYACRRFLYGVEPTDVTTLAIACAVLGAVAIGAAYSPARRASRVEPSSALRCD
jgi:predicted permease